MLQLGKMSDDDSDNDKKGSKANQDLKESSFKGNTSPLKKDTGKPKVEAKQLSKQDVKLVKGKDVPKEQTPKSTPKNKKKDDEQFKDEYEQEAYKIRVEDLTEIIINLEVGLKELTSRVNKSNYEDTQKRIKELEKDLAEAKAEVLMNNRKVQKFMEDGNRTLINQKDQIETVGETLEQIREELILQEHLLKKREDLVEKAHKDVEESQEAHLGTKKKNAELEYQVESLLTSINRLTEDKRKLDDEMIDVTNKTDKIEKHNLLVEELNKEMLDLNIEDLCQFINQSMYECIYNIKRDISKEVIKNSTNITEKLKSMGMQETLDAMDGLVEKGERKKSIDSKDAKDDKKDEEKGNETEEEEKAEFKERLEYAKKHNDLLKRLLNIGQHKVKTKDGKWRDKVTVGYLVDKFKKKWNSPTSLLGKVVGSKNKEKTKKVDNRFDYKAQLWELKKEHRKVIKENKFFDKENKKLLEKQERYEKLFSKVMYKILSGIQDVTDSYKGIVDFGSSNDDGVNKLMEKFNEKAKDGKELTDADVIKRLKKTNIDQLKELSQCKLLLQETKVDNEKYKKKDKELRNTITELKISFDDMQQRFEKRISEYNKQLELKDEKITNLSDHIKYQKKIVVDQDQKLSLMSSKVESENLKLRDAKQFQEMQNGKLKEYADQVNDLNHQIRDLHQERTMLMNQVKSEKKKTEQLALKMKTLEEIYYKADTKLMKENAKFLKLNDKYQEMERKYNEAKEVVVKEQTDKQILEMKLANQARNSNNPRGRAPKHEPNPMEQEMGEFSQPGDDDEGFDPPSESDRISEQQDEQSEK